MQIAAEFVRSQIKNKNAIKLSQFKLPFKIEQQSTTQSQSEGVKRQRFDKPTEEETESEQAETGYNPNDIISIESRRRKIDVLDRRVKQFIARNGKGKPDELIEFIKEQKEHLGITDIPLTE